ncbi:MAG TPA: nicotinate phosphoribosyltransferase [bacterium]|nr:nicotinate phosphoribosyltransferase [bacterium]
MATDCYNLSHWYLKENMDYEVSHIYNRSRGMILFGFNEIVIDLLNRQIEEWMIMDAEEHARSVGMKFPSKMWYGLIKDMKGYIPLKVEALPDGSWVPKGTPFAQVTNTEEGYGELVTWWEGVFLHSYFPSGCATEAMYLKRYLMERGTDTNKFHSFGFRGHRSMEDAYWAIKAWNMVMEGTDDFHGLQHTPNSNMSTIPATAHKTIQQFDNEIDAFKHAIDKVSEKGQEAVSLVIDTYDPWNIINNHLTDIIDYAQEREIIPVFRPDSGDIKEQAKAIYEKADLHAKGYPPFCGIIIGEGMDRKKIIEFDNYFKENNIPLQYISYGIGAGFYKHIDRDYLGFAMKTAYSNGKDRMKLTKSNPYKQSIPGYVNIVNDNGVMTVDYTKHGLYEIVYEMDERSSRPKYNRVSWCDIAKRVNLYTDPKVPLQEEIVLSPSVEQKKKEFRKRYL